MIGGHFFDLQKGLKIPPGKVMEALKSMYGLHTAQADWQVTLVAAMLEETFRCSGCTECITTAFIDSPPCILLTYVDDVIILGP